MNFSGLNILTLIEVVLFALIKYSSQGYPFDGIFFVKSGEADKRYLHQAGWDQGKRAYVARITLENGDQIPAMFIPELSNDIYFAQDGHMRHIQDHQKHKVEFLQHTTSSGLNWYHAYKTFNEDPGMKKNLTLAIGRLTTGERVFACRGFVEEARYDLLMLGRNIENREGCILHSIGNKQVIVEHFEVMGVSFLGQHEGGKRVYVSTVDYCHDCFYEKGEGDTNPAWKFW